MNDIKKICNATNLKYLAVALMFLDQIYQMFEYGGTYMVDDVGTSGFPDFPFLADSFHYTHDRMAFLRRCLHELVYDHWQRHHW
ncbi:MAG: hypothetical protein ACLTOX_02195 [Streptococcus thermophilus]